MTIRKRLLVASILMTSLSAMAQEINMVVGTYTDTGSKGLYSYSLNQETGKFVLQDSLAVVNPSYLTFSANGKNIFAVSERRDNSAALMAIGFDKKTGKMSLKSTQPTNGMAPCYVETNGTIAVTANYSGGNISTFLIGKDGNLSKSLATFRGNASNQASPQNEAHIHAARFDSDGNILATDFSADQLLKLKVEDSGKVAEPVVVGKLLPGSGPRHIEFSKSEQYVYVMSELAGTVSVFKKNRQGLLVRTQVIASDSVGGRGGADIHLTKDGKFLYTSNRLKADGISVFKVDSNTGKLTKIGYQLTGVHPRNFAITPNDQYLLVACRDSNQIQVYERNKKTGMLTFKHNIPVKKPVCVKFYD